MWATYLGGTHIDLPLTLTVDAQGAAIIVGWTSWVSKFPTTPGAFNRTFNGGNWDAFVAKLSPTGSSLVYSTFLGGAGREWAMALAVDSQGAGYCRWVDRFGKLPNHASSIRHKLQRHRPDWRRLRYATLTHGRETRLLDFPWREHG